MNVREKNVKEELQVYKRFERGDEAGQKSVDNA